jgi:hypothetical protein
MVTLPAKGCQQSAATVERRVLGARVALSHMCDAFKCPITHALMLDPVINAVGLTYERWAIEEWFKTNNVDPISRAPLPHKSLIPNVVLRCQIDDHVQANGVPDDWVCYAETLQDTESLLKLARLGIVTAGSLAAVRGVATSKKWLYTQTVQSLRRAERRVRTLQLKAQEDMASLQAATASVREMNEQAGRAGVRPACVQ